MIRLVLCVAGSVSMLLASEGCYPGSVPYQPTSVPTSFSMPPEQWVYKRGTVTALVKKRGNPRPVSAEEQEFAEKGFELANSILLSDCFKQGVTQAPMSHTNGLTSEKVYMSLIKGPPETLHIEFYDGGKKHGTIGYEDSKTPGVIHMNRYFVESVYDVANNLLHEAAHYRDYIHKSSREARSVPYTMNHIFEACAQKANLARSATPSANNQSPQAR